MINQNFIKLLTGLNTPSKIDVVKVIMAKRDEKVSVDAKFFNNEQKKKALHDEICDVVKTADRFLEALIKLESATAHGAFVYLLNEDYSDIMIHGSGYKLSDNLKIENHDIPAELLPIYRMFLDHFVDSIKFVEGKKFDVANADVDGEIDKLRFNMTHRSLTKDGFDIISIRKQTVKHFSQINDYIDSIGASPNQIQCIRKYAERGNVIIFGEVGSGKTTLLNYMGNYKLSDKRNPCTIEDTNELNIDVPIALLTSAHYKIKDLFTKALRQNPSSIIVGETRTDEIIDILEAALTIDVATTIHANTFLRAIQRIVFMSMKRNIPTQMVLDLVNASVDCFIFMKNRKVYEIWEHKSGVHTNIYEAYEPVL